MLLVRGVVGYQSVTIFKLFFIGERDELHVNVADSLHVLRVGSFMDADTRTVGFFHQVFEARVALIFCKMRAADAGVKVGRTEPCCGEEPEQTNEVLRRSGAATAYAS